VTDDNVLPVKRDTFAKDLATARPGEIVAVDGKGRMVTPRRIRKAQVVGAVLGIAIASTAMAIGSLAGGFVGMTVGAFVVLGVSFAVTMRWASAAKRLRAVNAHIFAGRRDDARAELARFGETRNRGLVEASRRACEGSVAYAFGEHADAVAHFENALALTTAPRHQLFRDTLHLAIASALAPTDLATARAHRKQVRGGHDAGIYVLAEITTDLVIAFETDKTDELPGDDVLHDRARVALEFHHSAATLVGLAWAFASRGDREMAEHLLDNVDDRSDAAYLGDAYPRLAAWRDGFARPPTA
jgi:hypothetical protein